MTWHAMPTDLDRYVRGDLDHALAASIETHLTACASCRRLVATHADGRAVARIKVGLDDRLDRPDASAWSAGLRRIGIGEADQRIVAASLGLHGSWLVAAVIAVGFAAVAAAGGNRGWLAAFLIAAPVVPLLGVALAFGPRVDPTFEIAVAAPLPVERIVVMRSMAVVGVVVPILFAASLLLPGPLSLAFVWLLPALGLATMTLALGTWVSITQAAIGLSILWAAAAGMALARAPRVTADAFVRAFVAFGPAGQVGFAIAIAVAVVVISARRTSFEAIR